MNNEIKGFSDGHQFRKANRYNETEKLFKEKGLTRDVENRTPTVGVNVAHLEKMEAAESIKSNIYGRDLSITILGISSADGPKDFQDLLKRLGSGRVKTTAIDLSDGIFEKIEGSGLDEVKCLLQDARETGIETGSQDINLRDHIGNCCPPLIDRQIDEEASRILAPGGISIVNITTSDFLEESKGRRVVNIEEMREVVGDEVITALKSNVYDLKELHEAFPELNVESMRGLIMEIEPGRSFVVFAEDEQGHGEWFRTIEDHQKSWVEHGFEIVGLASRKGEDSHEPPLVCNRHNVVLRKVTS